MPRIPRTTKPATRAASHAGKEKGDTSYNARRRFVRAAQRNLDKAEETTGATAARYRNLAKQDLEKALQTYDKRTNQDFSRPIKDLAASLDVNLKESRQQLKQTKDALITKMRNTAISKSVLRLEESLTDSDIRSEEEAKIVFGSPVGQRIVGGLVEKWREPATETYEEGGELKTRINKRKMWEAIYEYFGTDSLAEILKKVEEELGESLYRQGDKDEIYETVKLQIQNKVADNTLVA